MAELVAQAMMGTSDNVYVLLFLTNLFLFAVGMFLDAGPAILILGPVLGPLFVSLGVHPIHFAVVMFDAGGSSGSNVVRSMMPTRVVLLSAMYR